MAGGRKAARRFPKRDEAEARGRTGNALASLAVASEGWLEGEPSLDGPFRPCKGVRERRGLDVRIDGPGGPVHDGVPSGAQLDRAHAMAPLEPGYGAHHVAAASHGGDNA